MSALGPAHCRGCGLQVRWGRNDVTDKPAPIDVEATDDGNVVWCVDGTHYHVLTKEEKASGMVHLPRFKNHFATCGQAREFKRPDPAAARAAFEKGKAEG